MNREQIGALVQDVLKTLKASDEMFEAMASRCGEEMTLAQCGIDAMLFPDLVREIKVRLTGIDLSPALQMMGPDITLGALCDTVYASLHPGKANPVVVCVDDEESNLFVLKRWFGRDFTLDCFTDPEKALVFIQKTPDVALVITDEVMPVMTGNDLCDAVKATHPSIPFILVTANPQNDDDLLRRSLRHNRFYEFLDKPLNLEVQADTIRKLFRSLIH